MDLSKLSDADLMALKAGDLTKVSDAGLQALKGQTATATAPAQAAPEPSMFDQIKQQVGNVAGGAVRGAGSIGATLVELARTGNPALGGQAPASFGDRRTARTGEMDAALSSFGADPSSLAYKGGKLGTEIAGTMGAGGALANTIRTAAPRAAAAAPGLLSAIETSGMSAGAAKSGLAGTLANAGKRVAGGALAGGASAGILNPEDAGMGAAVGGALPPAIQLAGAAGKAVGAAARKGFGEATPEVAALAGRAKELGIDIPADRLVNSKPLDAIASALNYVPFSGRAATESKMAEQLNRAASKLIGQDTPNINKAIRAASSDLGAKFDKTLKNTGVAVDQTFLSDVANVYNTAQKELGSDALKPIASQVDELMAKGANGVIEGQAAYNIKRTLDRLGSGNTPTAYHAVELKKVLMEGLNRSLGPTEAQAFATTRQQYGNMLALEKLAKNGVEGEISVARLANMKNINNQPLQELADIAAQFVKPREGQHGAMQRAVVGLGTASTAGPLGLAAGAGVGRLANTTMNSDMLRRALMNQQAPTSSLLGPGLQALTRVAPGLLGER